jgi:hypothetical protein
VRESTVEGVIFKLLTYINTINFFLLIVYHQSAHPADSPSHPIHTQLMYIQVCSQDCSVQRELLLCNLLHLPMKWPWQEILFTQFQVLETLHPPLKSVQFQHNVTFKMAYSCSSCCSSFSRSSVPTATGDFSPINKT